MLETPHVFVGAAIAINIPNPAVALPLVFASHFVLDKIPHWNPHTYTETMKQGRPCNKTFTIAFADISIGLISGLAIANAYSTNINQFLYIILACAVSVFPDVVKYPFFLAKKFRTGLMKKYVDFERSLQADAPFIPGMLTQLLVILASYLWIVS